MKAFKSYFSKLVKGLKKEERITFGDSENLFIVSLYPSGRSAEDLLQQLRTKYSDSRESVIKERMNKWINKMKEVGLVDIVASNKGRVVGLSQKGKNYARHQINLLYNGGKTLVEIDNDNLQQFVKIMNRIIEEKDEWAINLFENYARGMVRSNLPFFTLIFYSRGISDIIRDLRAVFGIDLGDRARMDRFNAVVKKMNALGLLEIREGADGEQSILATNRARNLFRDYTVLDHAPVKRRRLGLRLLFGAERPSARDLLLSTIAATIISLSLVLIFADIGMWWAGFLPLLVLVIYLVVSKKR